MIVAAFVAPTVSSCADNDDDVVSSVSNPLSGQWSLMQVNGASLPAGQEVVVYFTPETSSADRYGKGTYQQGSSDPVSFTWAITSDNNFVVTSQDAGSGIYTYSMTITSTYRQLNLTNTVTGTRYILIN